MLVVRIEETMMVGVLEVEVHDVLLLPFTQSIVIQLARLTTVLVMAKLYLNSCEAVLGICSSFFRECALFPMNY